MRFYETVKNILLATTANIWEIAIEYATITLNPNPSESDHDRIDEILAMAYEDPVIDFWITEVDHLLAHYLNFLEPKNRERYIDQQAILSEFIGRPDILIDSPTKSDKSTRNFQYPSVTKQLTCDPQSAVGLHSLEERQLSHDLENKCACHEKK
jgi:hypothetical protein